MTKITVLPYSLTTPEIVQYDPSYPLMAKEIISFLEANFSDDIFFHFGSSAIPNCHGKPIIDLFIITKREHFESHIEKLENLGFQYPSFRDKPVNPERPCRVAKIRLSSSGEIHSHIHLTTEKSNTLSEAKIVIKRLSESNHLREQYVQAKIDAVKNGCDTFTKYSRFKAENFWPEYNKSE